MSKRILFRNSISGAVSTFTQVIVAFVMSPIIVHGLGNHQYGIWELLFGLAGYLGLLELGVGPALVRYVADSWSRNDQIALNRIFNTGVVTLTFSGLIGLLIFSAGSFWPEKISNLQPSETKELGQILLIFGLNLAATLPRMSLSAYLLGLQEYLFINTLLIVITILQSVAFYYVLATGLDKPLVWMAWVLFFSTLIQCFILVLWITFIDRKVNFDPREFNLQTMKTLLEYGLKNTLISASTGTLKKLVGIVIAYTVGVGAIVYFVVPNRLLEYGQSLGEAIRQPLTPYLADLAGKGDMVTTRHNWIQTTRILQIITFGTPLAAIGLGEPFIHIWMGQEYAVEGRFVLYILGIGLLIQGGASNSSTLLLSLAKHGSFSVFSAILAISCFLVSFPLGILWGINGIAGAIFIFIIGQAIASIVIACRIIEMSLIDYYRATIMYFIIPIILTACVLVGLRWIMYPDTYVDLLLEGLVAGIVYLTSTWYMALNLEERKYIKSKIL